MSFCRSVDAVTSMWTAWRGASREEETLSENESRVHRNVSESRRTSYLHQVWTGSQDTVMKQEKEKLRFELRQRRREAQKMNNLTMLGRYSVRLTSGWPPAERHSCLSSPDSESPEKQEDANMDCLSQFHYECVQTASWISTRTLLFMLFKDRPFNPLNDQESMLLASLFFFITVERSQRSGR